MRHRVVAAVTEGTPRPSCPTPADELDSAVETARSQIARSIQLSGLKNDPLVHLMQAVAVSLGRAPKRGVGAVGKSPAGATDESLA